MSIQLKRGTKDIIETSTIQLDPGQPLVDITNRKLYVGEKNIAIKDLVAYNVTPEEFESFTSIHNNIENSDAKGSIKQLKDADFTLVNTNATDNGKTISSDATGQFATALGGKSRAEGKRAFSVGTQTIAKGNYSAAFGNNSVAEGVNSFVAGSQNTAKNNSAAVFGAQNIAWSDNSFVEGTSNKTITPSSHIEGVNNSDITGSLGSANHIEGSCNTVLGGSINHVEGGGPSINGSTTINVEKGHYLNNASYAHIEGRSNVIDYGTHSHVEGILNKVTNTIPTDSGTTPGTGSSNPGGDSSGSTWDPAEHKGETCHIEGDSNEARAYCVHIEGYSNTSESPFSHIHGVKNYIKGHYGQSNSVMGENNLLTNSTKSIIGGINNELTATNMSVVLGGQNKSNGTTTSTIIGTGNTINGDSNFVIGNNCISSIGAEAVIMAGQGLATSIDHQTLIGSLNDQTLSDNNDFKVIIGTGSGSDRDTTCAFSQGAVHTFAKGLDDNIYYHSTINPTLKSIQFGNYSATNKTFTGSNYIFDSALEEAHVAAKEREVYSSEYKTIPSSATSLNDVLVSGTYYINTTSLDGPRGKTAIGDILVVFSPSAKDLVDSDEVSTTTPLITQTYYLKDSHKPCFRQAYKSRNNWQFNSWDNPVYQTAMSSTKKEYFDLFKAQVLLTIGTGTTTSNITKTSSFTTTLPNSNYYKCAGGVDYAITGIPDEEELLTVTYKNGSVYTFNSSGIIVFIITWQGNTETSDSTYKIEYLQYTGYNKEYNWRVDYFTAATAGAQFTITPGSYVSKYYYRNNIG